jgi:hypothetical protein
LSMIYNIMFYHNTLEKKSNRDWHAKSMSAPEKILFKYG